MVIVLVLRRLYASGGDPLYSYMWDNGETGIIATSLTSGYHSVFLLMIGVVRL